MDGHQFDDLLRTLAHSRRAAIVTLVSAAAGLAGLPAADARKKKKCRGCPACTQCVKGKCRTVPDRTACGGVCDECVGGQCVPKAAGATCGGTNQCLNGVCNARPDCLSAGEGGCAVHQNCCSGDCPGTPPTHDFCLQGITGTPCKVNADCTSEECVGYRCL